MATVLNLASFGSYSHGKLIEAGPLVIRPGYKAARPVVLLLHGGAQPYVVTQEVFEDEQIAEKLNGNVPNEGQFKSSGYCGQYCDSLERAVVLYTASRLRFLRSADQITTGQALTTLDEIAKDCGTSLDGIVEERRLLTLRSSAEVLAEKAEANKVTYAALYEWTGFGGEPSPQTIYGLILCLLENGDEYDWIEEGIDDLSNAKA